ncbi:sensor histidine kinase [Flavobacterium sp. NKUCC04_CG]|uniref:sensor histidine kinase n=1 Tax=Flavobacterium sp. NKUCC04_CG TaxID=2842121 RepID=UPI001C5B59AE|nr:histidine kinase [Flavobacterium sp. NKUCC04_CG]MBW3519322.1 histidine kinase [Flavobacterium sp. NKUCC04_CG]
MNTKWTYSNIWLRNMAMYLFLFIIFFTAQYFDATEVMTTQTIIDELVLVLTLIYAFIFFHNTVIVKPFLLNKKYQLFFLFSFLWWAFYIAVATKINLYRNDHDTLANQIGSVIVINFVGTGVYFIHVWIHQNVITTQKKLLNTEAELEVLKLQLNPHFLLNALNNLYGVALSNPQDTPNRILELAELLRYQIESTKKDYISIFEEVDFIKKYISYHQFKSNNLTVVQEYSGIFSRHKIPPLLFILLVENALKFSAQTEKAMVSLRLDLDGGDLIFSIENGCLPNSEKVEGTRMGLENLKRRLEVTAIKYKLDIESTNGNFKVVLYLWQLPITVL